MATSSEIVHSTRFSGHKKAPEKSNFSQTCSLLSQYLKHKGNLADLNLGITNGMPETCRQVPVTETMNLLPVLEKPEASVNSMNQILSKAEPEKKKSEQMTIFYDGQVIVFNDFPAEKVNELMLLAGKGDHHTSNLSVFAPSNIGQRPPQPTIADLPIARKASLHRFLEKRKDRITAKAPYQLNNSSTSKNDGTKSWLGLDASA